MNHSPENYFWAVSTTDNQPKPFKKAKYRDLWLGFIDEPGEVRSALTYQQARTNYNLGQMMRAIRAKYPERKNRVRGLLMKRVNTDV